LLRRAANAFGVRVIQSNVVRDRALAKGEFGLFLARHYKFMLDSVLRSSAHAGSYVIVPPIQPYDYVVVVEDDLKLANGMKQSYIILRKHCLKKNENNNVRVYRYGQVFR
jgi:hypothetical protein